MMRKRKRMKMMRGGDKEERMRSYLFHGTSGMDWLALL